MNKFYVAGFLIPIIVILGCKKIDKELPDEVLGFRKVIKSNDSVLFVEKALKLRQWMIKNDQQYPIYHFCAPESWINDPNGPIYFNGKYHLFYQYDPVVKNEQGNWVKSKRTWGHAVSSDLVHWKDWPVAVWPDTRYDKNVVYSGNTFVDDNGNLCGLYTASTGGRKETYGMLIKSNDGGLNI